MRKKSISLFLTIGLCLTASGCVVPTLTAGNGSTSSDLGPETVEAGTPTDNTDTRLEAGCEWLWQSYTALKAKVDPAVQDMRELYVNAQEMLVAVQAGDVVKALRRYLVARALVTALAGAV